MKLKIKRNEHEQENHHHHTYANGQQLTVTMKDKVVELAEVVVGKKNKPQKIAGKAVSGPMASFRGKGKVDGTEWGPVFKSKKDYVISDILLTIKGTSYQWCVLSFNVYEIRKGMKLNNNTKPFGNNETFKIDCSISCTSIRAAVTFSREAYIFLRAAYIFSRAAVTFAYLVPRISYLDIVSLCL